MHIIVECLGWTGYTLVVYCSVVHILVVNLPEINLTILDISICTTRKANYQFFVLAKIFPYQGKEITIQRA